MHCHPQPPPRPRKRHTLSQVPQIQISHPRALSAPLPGPWAVVASPHKSEHIRSALGTSAQGAPGTECPRRPSSKAPSSTYSFSLQTLIPPPAPPELTVTLYFEILGGKGPPCTPSSLSFLSKFKPQTQPFPLPHVDVYMNLLHRDLGVSTDQTTNLETLLCFCPQDKVPVSSCWAYRFCSSKHRPPPPSLTST